MKLEIIVSKHYDADTEWISAEIEDSDGDLLGKVTAPIVEGATFDTRGAVIRAAVEKALPKLQERIN